MWLGTRRSICYCSNSARGQMRFRWTRHFFPCSGQWPARDGEEEPPAGPLDAMFPSLETRWDLAWGRRPARDIVTGRAPFPNIEARGHLPDGEGALPWAPAGLTPPRRMQGQVSCFNPGVSGNGPNAGVTLVGLCHWPWGRSTGRSWGMRG